MKFRFDDFTATITHWCDLSTLALYRFAARRCMVRGLRPELLCQHVRAEPVTKAVVRSKRRPPKEFTDRFNALLTDAQRRQVEEDRQAVTI